MYIKREGFKTFVYSITFSGGKELRKLVKDDLYRIYAELRMVYSGDLEAFLDEYLDDAIKDMDEKGTNIAHMGDIRGSFLYSARLDN